MTEVEFQFYQKTIKPPFVIMKTGITEKEFLEFASEDISCELLNGVLYMYSPASVEHERIFRFLLSLLNDFLQRKNMGEVLGSHVVMRLGPTDIPEPDLVVILKESKVKMRETFVEGPADFVVEILSPSTRIIDITEKVPLYLSHGVREIWIIDPVSKNLTVHLQDEKPKEYSGEDRVTSQTILGFWVLVKWLWPETAPRTFESLNEILG